MKITVDQIMTWEAAIAAEGEALRHLQQAADVPLDQPTRTIELKRAALRYAQAHAVLREVSEDLVEWIADHGARG
jgi:hypothetical protein